MEERELFDAIRSGDEPAVRALLAENPELRNARSNGISPVLFACYTGHAAMAPALLEGGAGADFAEACALGDEARVRALFAENPRLLDAFSADGFPPLGLAIFFRHPELAQFLIERGADVKAQSTNAQRVAPVHAAAAVGDRATLRLLLEHHADPNARQHGGYTPLHEAAAHGDDEMVDLLLAAHADPSLTTDDGKSAADLAAERGHPALADRLRNSSTR